MVNDRLGLQFLTRGPEINARVGGMQIHEDLPLNCVVLPVCNRQKRGYGDNQKRIPHSKYVELISPVAYSSHVVGEMGTSSKTLTLV